jgi:hypothetical protein
MQNNAREVFAEPAGAATDFKSATLFAVSLLS